MDGVQGRMILAQDTWLGELRIVDVYIEHDGPRLFSASSGSGNHYLVVATDEGADRTQWLYAPLTRATLESVRTGSVDLAVPFRSPEGGFAFRVTTFRTRKPSLVVPVRGGDVTEEELPRSGFHAELHEPPTLWRAEAIAMAQTSHRDAHETRVISKTDDPLAPAFVSQLVRRWDNFVSTFANVDLRVAAVLPGSLRAVFTAAKAPQGQMLSSYERLVGCASDANALTKQLDGAKFAGAYFDLIGLLAQHHCAFEVSTLHGSALNVRTMRAEIARAQHEALEQSKTTTFEVEIRARVTAASLSRSSLELKHEDKKREEMHVNPDSRRQLNGLRIGGLYKFSLRETITVVDPATPPRIDVDIRSAIPESTTTSHATLPNVVHVRPTKPLTWSKELSPTDALHAKSGHLRAYVPLTRGAEALNNLDFFRKTFFGHLDWEKVGDQEISHAAMRVRLMGTSYGLQPFKITHAFERAKHHKDPPTRLYWNDLLRELLLENDWTGKLLTLSRDAHGELSLRVGGAGP